ncbi:hypothetical protein LIER_30440 [Lithospermum erythrorhizon]|uniref:Integrase catalytic domain-containing protein n=1 Tax=Lithospermum erythrorhizon TaxID=34254 RepID=A0AAV3RQR6_LITER
MHPAEWRLPEDLQKRVDIRRRAPRFLYYNDSLSRRSFGEVLLRCLSNAETAQAMSEAHSGYVELTSLELSYIFKLRGWVTTDPPCSMETSFINRRNHCTLQRHDGHSTHVGWAWSDQCLNLQNDIFKSLQLHTTSLSGQKPCIITDNGKSFDNKLIADLCAKFKFKKYHSSMYYP